MNANTTSAPIEDEHDDDPPALDFEAWATLSARIAQLGASERAALLEGAKLDEEQWERCEEHHRGVLSSDLRGLQLERASLYGAKCAEEQARRKAEKAALASAGSARSSAAQGQDFGAVTLSEASGAPRGAPAPLPFKQGPASAPIIAPPESSPPKDMGRTIPLTHAETDAPLPFAGTGPEVALTLEQYASFRAELAAALEDESQIQAKYGVTDKKARRDLDELWRKRFASDRPTQQRFLALSTRYRDELLAQKRS